MMKNKFEMDELKDCIITFPQAQKELKLIENKLAKRLNITSNIRKEIIKCIENNTLVEDELVIDWHEAYSLFTNWFDKLLFLDIDGVLITGNYIKKIGDAHIFDPKTIKQLIKIIEETNCSIVISSTWRLIPEDLKKCLNSIDIEYKDIIKNSIIGETPYLSTARGSEIQSWLTENEYEGKFVILDDDSDMEPLKDYLIKTKFNTGLTSKIADKVIKKLNKD